MNKLKVIEIDKTGIGTDHYGAIEFENGVKLYSFHESDCCEKHELYLKDLTLEEFDGWKQKTSKESLRKYYSNSERIIFAEKQSFGKMLKDARTKYGYTTISLAGIIGAFGKTNHGGSVSNWENDLNIPTEEQYDKLQSLLKLPNRSDSIRLFNAKSDVQYTDVLHYKTVRPYKGKHPCEKPRELIKHLVEMSSNENDIVIDCFAGSSVLVEACIETKRNWVAIEKDEDYYNMSLKRLEDFCNINKIT